MSLPRARRRALRSGATTAVAALALSAALAVTPTAQAAQAATSAAPGGPGALSFFDLGRKDCVGTARNTTSKVWFTVANGVLSDVYEPTIDNTNVHDLDFVVTDGRSFTDLQTRDLSYTVSADDTGMQCTITATSKAHGYQLVTTYVADPDRDTVLLDSQLRDLSRPPRNLKVFARLDAHVNGNGGGGDQNGGADSGVVTRGVPVVGDPNTVSQAANRDYAVPTYMALDATSLHSASVGYAGTASDGLTALDATHRLATTYSTAPNGHVIATADVTPKPNGAFTIALGFGRTQQQALETASASLGRDATATQRAYTRGWQQYDAGLVDPFGHGKPADPSLQGAYLLSANVLKASEDKTFPGAIAASLASPWGQAVSAGALVNGKPVYFGSYREPFARDLYEAATGMIADGDVATARAAALFLFNRQQGSNGQMPRNSLLNGKVAPDTGGDQLDETAYPILLAYLTGLGNDAAFYRQHIVPAADFVVAHGPSFGVERWEEQSGYSPSTIAAEIAGLTAAAAIAHQNGDDAHARIYQAVADDFQRTVKKFTVTTNGPLSSNPYFLRLSKDGNPNNATTYNLGNGSVTVDQRGVADGGFQDLVRLGELPADDPDVVNSLKVVENTIGVSTQSGTGYYRYGTDTPGSEDGYGDCWTPDPTDCPKDGQPWPTTDTGSGHLWPVLSGERAETALAQGDPALARAQLGFMLNSASGEGLVPEQAWEDPNLPASPYGTDPRTASIGFVNGKAAGSAAPLTWAEGQQARLIVDLAQNRIVDRPDITTNRYVTHAPPAAVPVAITSPQDNSQQSGSTPVTGTAPAGSTIDVSVVDNDVPGNAPVVSTTADSGGTWSVTVPIGFGTNVITASATRGGGTGVARITVTGDLVGGTTVLDVTDPTGDDNGPGTYQYPNASAFAPGSYDLTRFQVLTKDGTVYLRTTIRDIVNTFGNDLGAQLFDIYVHRPGATTTSTASRAPSSNYSIAPADAWSQRIEVQGFAAPIWVDPNGNQVGTVNGVVTSTAANTVTIALPQAQFGTPASGWSFTLALFGQDGYGTDQARNFTQPATDYTFGVCPVSGGSPICSVDPARVARVMDTIPPAGISQAGEWDLSTGSAVLHGVPVP